MQLPPLNALRVFDAVSRFENLSKAADSLHITHSAASQQLKLLENYLNVSLIDRSKKKLQLSPRGQRFAEQINRAFTTLHDAVHELKQFDLKHKRIALNTPTWFASYWLFKRLNHFQTAYPCYDLVLSTPFRIIDFSYEDFDAAVYYGAGGWADVEAIKLGDGKAVAVCSKVLYQQLTRDQELSPYDFTLIRSTSSAVATTDINDWHNWLKMNHYLRPNRSPHFLELNTTDAMISAVLNHLGLALIPRFLVEDRLTDGSLVSPFTGDVNTDFGYYFVYPLTRRHDPKVVALRDWLLDEIGNR